VQLFLVDDEIEAWLKGWHQDKLTLEKVRQLVTLRDRLAALLWAFGTLVTLVVVSIAALRHAFNAHQQRQSPPPGRGLPQEAVLAYGAFYTLVLAVFYLPVHVRLLTASRKVGDALFREPDTPDAKGVKKLWQERQEFDKALGLDGDWLDSFKSGVAILSPLL